MIQPWYFWVERFMRLFDGVPYTLERKRQYLHLSFSVMIRLMIYVAAKATYIRLLHGKIGISEGVFRPNSVHRGWTHIVLG